MSIPGILRLTDTTKKVNEVGERVLLEAANNYLEQHNTAWERAEQIWVQEVTEKFKFRYELPGGGFMQRRGGLARPGAVKPIGGWNVEVPLEGFGDDIGVAKDEFAYMNVASFQRVVDGIRIRSINTRRYEMLRAIYNSTARPFADRWAGDLTIQPLAITSDGVIYPPGVGQTVGATAQHYITSDTYDETGISNTNNPYATIRAKFGVWNPSPNRIVSFINSAQRSLTEALADFVAVSDLGIVQGANADTAVYPSDLPALPGTLIGRVPGVWIVEWDAGVPARYIMSRDLDAPAPLMRRRHPAVTGIGDGLRLVAKSDVHPLMLSSYEDDFGFGAVNRLGAVVMELTLDPTYDTPAEYV